MRRLDSKIKSPESLKRILAKLRKHGKRAPKIVFTNGCFDILHKGHVTYLQQARKLGDILVVALNTDASVSKLKGLHRPIQDEQSRLTIIAALQCVNAVVLFDEETPYELIKLVQPDVLVKGSDYKPENIVGYDIVIAKGGQVKTIDYLPGFSTSEIEKRIKEA